MSDGGPTVMDQPVIVPNDPPPSYTRFYGDTLSLAEEDIPLRPENRKRTDIYFLYFFFIAVVILVPFLIYTLHNLNIDPFNATTKHGDPNPSGGKLFLACILSFFLCVISAALFKYFTKVYVWSVLIISWLYFFILTIAAWCGSRDIGFPIVITLVTVGLLCLLVYMKDKIHLVIMLFKETTKAVYDMKALFFMAGIVVFLGVIVASLFTVAIVYILYMAIVEQSGSKTTALLLNVIMAIWIIEFLNAIQYMSISGAVTKWYFTRHKEFLGKPVSTSFYITMKFHLGTVALGSFIITMVTFLRAVVRSLSQNSRLKCLMDCCMSCIEDILRIFSKSAYIITAMHGTPFIPSGKKAVGLFKLNICNTVTINSIGDFVLVMSQVLLVGLSFLISCVVLGKANKYPGADDFYLFVGVITFFCSYIIFGTYEAAFSTLFLCVSEDFVMNNGDDKPYAMTMDMMEFMENSKKVFAKKIQEKNLPTF